VQVDALALRMRPRTPREATDLGVRLCQSTARSVFRCHAVAAIPVMSLALASGQIGSWVPFVAIWWAKPWLDRTILFVLSRAAFGQDTHVVDLWRSQNTVWWEQFFFTWTIRRLSIWRSFTQPVYQLEGGSIWKAKTRVRQIRRHGAASAFVMTQVFAISELLLAGALVSLVFWFAPAGQTLNIIELSGRASFAIAAAYALAVFFLEPFYVASGFAMYLNRRADLEAWDIEQEFRRAFAH
jgi:hypothetical protein